MGAGDGAPTRGAGRFAPSPSGDLHVGNLRTAILAWTWARRTGRRFVVRIEDLERTRPGVADRQLRDLEAIGLDWDGPVLYQSRRADAYRRALDDLAGRGLLFECYCSRRDIRLALRAPHGAPELYPGTCLNLDAARRRAGRERLAARGQVPALRLRAPAARWRVRDELAGEVWGPVDHPVLRRNDGSPAYNLAVVVDDAAQGVDQVVRGDDLLASAPAQACLAHLLGLSQPTYAHVPLVLGPGGRRLAKRDGAVTLEGLRAVGRSAADVVRAIGESLGVAEASDARDLARRLDLRRLPRVPWTFPV